MILFISLPILFVPGCKLCLNSVCKKLFNFLFFLVEASRIVLVFPDFDKGMRSRIVGYVNILILF